MYTGGQAVNAYTLQSQRDHQPSMQPEIVNLSPLVRSLIQKHFRFSFSNVSIQDEIPETQSPTNPPLVAVEHGELICENVVNNDEGGSTVTNKKNRKRPMKPQGGARKRSKNKLPDSVRHYDGELTSEIETGSVNRESEVVAEASTLQGRGMRQTTSNSYENTLAYLADRLRTLEAKKEEPVVALQKELADLKKTLDTRDSTIAYQATALNFLSTVCAPVMKELLSRI